MPRSASETLIRTDEVYRARLTVGRAGDAAARAFADGRAAVLGWLDGQVSRHAGMPLAALGGEFVKGHSFLARAGEARFEVVEDRDRRGRPPFAVRCVVPDADEPLRRWAASAALRISGGAAEIDASLAVIRDLRGGDVPLLLSVPDLLGAVADGPGVSDAALPIGGGVLRVRAPADVEAFCRLVLDPSRRLPVVAASAPFLLDIDTLGSRLRGVAHVAAIWSAMTWAITNALGPAWSQWGGSVRVYRAPFSRSDDRHEHPVVAGRVVESWDGGRGAAAFFPALVERAFQAAADAAGALPGFGVDEARREIAMRPRRRADGPAVGFLEGLAADPAPSRDTDGRAADAVEDAAPAGAATGPDPTEDVADLRAEFERERVLHLEREAALAAENARLHGIVQQQENDYLALVQEHDAAEAAWARRLADAQGPTDGGLSPEAVPMALRGPVAAFALLQDALQAAVADVSAVQRERDEAWRARAGGGADGAEYPDTLAPDAVAAWVEARLPGRVVLHRNALESLRGSVYERPGDVYAALDLLGREYRDMRLRRSGSEREREAFEERLRALHLRVAPAISEAALGKSERHYTVRHDGADRILDLHLRSGGATADPRRCLRVYFFWDPDRRAAVVGSLPGHLPNTMS